MVLVKVHAVALNPCDYKMASRFPSPGAIDGCDFSGTVVAQGPVAEKIRSFQVGDRVCGAVHGSNPIDHQSGSFAEYVAIDAEFLFKIPDSLSFDDAAAIGGTVVGTLGLVFFDSLALSGSLAKPAEKPAVVLVYGGSTSVGTMSIQLLKL
jgi:NADPH:quinone reductase-like Zn-dependent oxidoreductase